jgi:hypothetical protein
MLGEEPVLAIPSREAEEDASLPLRLYLAGHGVP